MSPTRLLSIALSFAAVVYPATTTAQMIQGTSAYLQFSDSPFSSLNFSYFWLENFEDHLFNVPGVTASAGGVTSVVFGPSIHDSVDGDDGVIDGSGLNGESFFSNSGPTGITFTFNAAALGGLPTHAGLVWTDGVNPIFFEAFDGLGNSLGTLTGQHANASFSGETAEDRFYGAIHAGGIARIFIRNGAAGIEIDHLQYGLGAATVVPEPATLVLLGTGLLAVAAIRRRRTHRHHQRPIPC